MSFISFEAYSQAGIIFHAVGMVLVSYLPCRNLPMSWPGAGVRRRLHCLFPSLAMSFLTFPVLYSIYHCCASQLRN
jgi:hypothetical protein